MSAAPVGSLWEGRFSGVLLLIVGAGRSGCLLGVELWPCAGGRPVTLRAQDLDLLERIA